VLVSPLYVNRLCIHCFITGTGALLPSRARIWLAPYRDETLYDESWDETVAYWTRPVHGLDMSAVAAVAASQITEKPRVGRIEAEGMMSSVRRVCIQP